MVVPIGGIYTAYYAYASHKNKKSRDQLNAGNIKSNEQIATELAQDRAFVRFLGEVAVTKSGKEKYIRKELKKRNFDFEKSDIVLEFKLLKWTGISVKDYQTGSSSNARADTTEEDTQHENMGGAESLSVKWTCPKCNYELGEKRPKFCPECGFDMK